MRMVTFFEYYEYVFLLDVETRLWTNTTNTSRACCKPYLQEFTPYQKMNMKMHEWSDEGKKSIKSWLELYVTKCCFERYLHRHS